MQSEEKPPQSIPGPRMSSEDTGLGLLEEWASSRVDVEYASPRIGIHWFNRPLNYADGRLFIL